MANRLCKKSDSKLVSLADLRLLPEPVAMGSRHKPVHPAVVVETVMDKIKKFGGEIADTQLALNSKRTRLAGVVDVKPFEDNAESGYSIGFITSVNESTALRFVGGHNFCL